MSLDSEIAPVLSRRFVGGTPLVPGIVDDVLDEGMRKFEKRSANHDNLELLGLALNEVLHTVTEVCGQQTDADNSYIDLWRERTFVIVCVRFRGAALPDWLIANWDRSQEPAMLAPTIDSGWGWLVVREALDAVSHQWSGSEQMLFLEKRM